MCETGVVFLGVVSMLLGSFYLISVDRLFSILVYSSVMNLGWILFTTVTGFFVMLIYLGSYFFIMWVFMGIVIRRVNSFSGGG